MRVLVTGANGFVGRHLVAELDTAGHTPLRHGYPAPAPGETWFSADLSEAGVLDELVQEQAPDACVHLAGLAFVPTADKHPAVAFQINALGTLHLLATFRHHAPAARILVVTSSQVYGPAVDDRPISEDHPLCPQNFYAASKSAADQVARLHARQFGMDVMTARPHNHIGPGQSPDFVSSAFSRQLRAIATGDAEPVLRVGNLESERDFLDVRDVVHAYRRLLESGRAGEAYNIATGTRTSIRILLDTLCDLCGVQPERQVDPGLFRPTDHSAILDTARIRERTGWAPTVSLKQTLRDILAETTAAQG